MTDSAEEAKGEGDPEQMEDPTCSAEMSELDCWVSEVCVILAFGVASREIKGWGWCGWKRRVMVLCCLRWMMVVVGGDGRVVSVHCSVLVLLVNSIIESLEVVTWSLRALNWSWTD